MIYSNGYSYVRVSERYEGYEDVIPTRPPSFPGLENSFEGDELLINQGKLDALLQEVTVGFSYSRKISHNIGLGFTLLGAYRDQTKVRYASYAAFDTTNQRSATTDIFADIDYWAVRLSGKFGISIDWENIKLGATITTPSIALKFASGGTDHLSLTSNNVFVFIDSTTNEVQPVDILASDRQEGLPVTYNSPLSISAGIEYALFENTKVHIAGEWFAPLSAYVVIQTESKNFIRNNPLTEKPIDSAELLRVYDAMKTVFNLGLAFEHKLNDNFTGYAAVRTDFSNANYEEIEGLAVGFTNFNIYHFTGGMSFQSEDTFLGVGIEYSHGRNSNFRRIFNFPTVYNNFNIFFGVTQLL
jgi:hypothetical protein